jgi:hypothetical protein
MPHPSCEHLGCRIVRGRRDISAYGTPVYLHRSDATLSQCANRSEAPGHTLEASRRIIYMEERADAGGLTGCKRDHAGHQKRTFRLLRSYLYQQTARCCVYLYLKKKIVYTRKLYISSQYPVLYNNTVCMFKSAVCSSAAILCLIAKAIHSPLALPLLALVLVLVLPSNSLAEPL